MNQAGNNHDGRDLRNHAPHAAATFEFREDESLDRQGPEAGRRRQAVASQAGDDATTNLFYLGEHKTEKDFSSSLKILELIAVQAMFSDVEHLLILLKSFEVLRITFRSQFRSEERFFLDSR